MKSDTERPDEIAIYSSLSRSAVAILICSLAIWYGIRIGVKGSEVGKPAWEIILWAYVVAPLFGWGVLLMVYQLVSGRPLLVVNSSGITDSSTLPGPRHVRWDEVDHLRLSRIKSGQVLQIVPKDADAFWRQRGAVEWFFAKINHPFSKPPMTIWQGTMSMSLTDLADLLHARYGARVEGHEPSTPSAPIDG